MNVEPGDLARVVAPYAMQGRGSFVTIECDARLGTVIENGEVVGYAGAEQAWIVSGWIREWRGLAQGPRVIVADCCLRRVDPGLGRDAMLRAVDKKLIGYTPKEIA